MATSVITHKVLRKTVSGTTTSSGALDMALLSSDRNVLSVRSTGGANIFGFPRGDGYITVFSIQNSVLTPLVNTSVSFEILYY